MHIPETVLIGRPAHNEPSILGEWTHHELPEDILIGQSVCVELGKDKCEFSVNVAYVPSNPRKQQLITIMEPKTPIPESIWKSDGFTKYVSDKEKIDVDNCPF